MSTATNGVLIKDTTYWIGIFSKKYKVEQALIKAIIQQESKDNHNAMRIEKHLKKAGWYTKWLSTKEKKNPYSYFSMGSMQVLFAVAKSYGYKGTPHGLLEPEYSIEYGTKHLQKLIKRFYNIESVISAYNQGSPRRYKTGKQKGQFRNQQLYVNPVKKYYKKFGGKIKLK